MSQPTDQPVDDSPALPSGSMEDLSTTQQSQPRPITLQSTLRPGALQSPLTRRLLSLSNLSLNNSPVTPSPASPPVPLSSSLSRETTQLALHSPSPLPLPSTLPQQLDPIPLDSPSSTPDNVHSSRGAETVTIEDRSETRTTAQPSSSKPSIRCPPIPSSASSKRWMPFQSAKEADGKDVNGLWISQLPRPTTAKEKEEQRLEWTTREYSEEEMKELYRMLLIINRNDLAHHHDYFPSFRAFTLFNSHLPAWIFNNSTPKWRSPTDESLYLSPNSKLFRFIYYWRATMELREAKELLNELDRNEWHELAKKCGNLFSYREVVKGARKVIEEAERNDAKEVTLFKYVGLGAESEQSINTECRSFAHVKPSAQSLIGVVFNILRSWRAKKPSSSIRLQQTFITTLPVATFPHSGYIFSIAETIYAVALKAAPLRGGLNVVACGNVAPSAAIRKFLGKMADTQSLDPKKLPQNLPLYPRCLVLDRALRHNLKTVGEFKFHLNKPEGKKAANEDESGTVEMAGEPEEVKRERLRRTREEEERLEKEDEANLGGDLRKMHFSSHNSRSSSTVPSTSSYHSPHDSSPVASTSSYSTSSPDSHSLSPSNPSNSSSSSGFSVPSQVRQRSLELGLSNLTPPRRDQIVKNLGYNYLMPQLRLFHNDPVLHADLIAYLYYRAVNTSGVSTAHRTFDNIFDKHSIRSASGNLFRATVGHSQGKQEGHSDFMNIVGLAITGDNEVKPFKIALSVRETGTGNAIVFTLRWNDDEGGIELLQDGDPVMVGMRKEKGATGFDRDGLVPVVIKVEDMKKGSVSPRRVFGEILGI